MCRNRHLPARAKGPWAYSEHGRSLAALVFAAEHQLLHAGDGLGAAGLGAQLGHKGRGLRIFLVGQMLALDMPFENLVEHGIGRQAVLVLLAGSQFGRGRLVDDGLRDQLAARMAVDMA